VLCTSLCLSLAAADARAFCGFYVARAESELFNDASKVVIVRDGDRTVLTMANDYEGEPSEFAMVVPVPVVLQQEQVHVGNPTVLAHLDAFTAPRLVEYYDGDPCREVMRERLAASAAQPLADAPISLEGGVTIEASYTVGEYDILILSAEQSDGLLRWLQENGYRVPQAAEPIVKSYLAQGLKFFVAKVNLEEQARTGLSKLRPLQMAFDTERFGLPIRLGTVNARGRQELFVYTLTRTGRVETTNYRTVRLPTGDEVPVYVKAEFDDFYRDMFARQAEQSGGTGVFLEYAWDMGWCDPCAADPLSASELRELGVFWVEPTVLEPRARVVPSPVRDVFVTRLHVRYDAQSFPEDLAFQQTGDRTNFQGRYVLRHPWLGSSQCEAATAYRKELPARMEAEAQTLARLTGWDLEEIRGKLPVAPSVSGADAPWWKSLWPDD